MYLPLVLGVPACLAAGWFELTRALGGREIAWVYTFEWPFYAVVGTYMWWQIWHRAPREVTAASDAARTNDRSRVDGGVPEPDAAAMPDLDPELEAWQSYLARLHAADPPGSPPAGK